MNVAVCVAGCVAVSTLNVTWILWNRTIQLVDIWARCESLKCVALYCSELQCDAVSCELMQCDVRARHESLKCATCSDYTADVWECEGDASFKHCSMLQCIAVWCSVTCSEILRFYYRRWELSDSGAFCLRGMYDNWRAHCLEGHTLVPGCSVVQCGAVWCSVVQRGVICCSVLKDIVYCQDGVCCSEW